MEFKKEYIEKLKNHSTNCNVFSVYDYNDMSMQELLCTFYTRINECIDLSNKTFDLVDWLVSEGLSLEVSKKLELWLSDGTIENLINDKIFKDLNDKLINVLEKVSLMEQKIINKLDDNNTNYIVGCKRYKFRDDVTGSTYWINEVPMTDRNGNRVILKQGYSKYYRDNPLQHEPKDKKILHEKVSDMSNFYNATIAINGSADGNNGVHGINYNNGVIRKDSTGGWFTMGVKNDGSIHCYDPSIKCQPLIDLGCEMLLDGFQPLVIDGKEPSDDIKYFNDETWFTALHPRSAIGHDKELNKYIFATFNGRVHGEKGFRYSDVCRIMLSHGMWSVMGLDGGGSVNLCYKGVMENYKIDDNGNNERLRPHIIYVGYDNDCLVNEESSENMKVLSEINSKVLDVENSNFDNAFFKSDYKNNPIPGDDLNTIRKSGVYWSRAWIVGNPNTTTSFMIFHIQIGEVDSFQYAIPYNEDGSVTTMIRRTRGGVFTEWCDISKTSVLKPTSNINSIRECGRYWSQWDTIGNPNAEISYGIEHYEIIGGFRMQYAFPYDTKIEYPTLMRRTVGSSWSAWVVK